jgi:hypothetical protein
MLSKQTPSVSLLKPFSIRTRFCKRTVILIITMISKFLNVLPKIDAEITGYVLLLYLKGYLGWEAMEKPGICRRKF